jgi:hypothetical protein
LGRREGERGGELGVLVVSVLGWCPGAGEGV